MFMFPALVKTARTAQTPLPLHLLVCAENCHDLRFLTGLLRETELDLHWHETRAAPREKDPRDHADVVVVAEGATAHFSTLWERHASLQRLPIILVQDHARPKQAFATGAIRVLEWRELSASVLARAVKTLVGERAAAFRQPSVRRVEPRASAMH
jgi:hypothetical protein